MTEIIQTKPGAANFNLFADFPEKIYPTNSMRFKLTETINPEFLEACFILSVNGKSQARAALYNNPELIYQNKKSFCIGNYESTDDLAVSGKLLTAIFDTAKQKGAQFIIGPMNGSTWDNYRFSVHHDSPNFFLEPYHHLYYNKHFLNFGFKEIAKYFSNIDSSLAFGDADVVKRKQELVNNGIIFRTINTSIYEQELDAIYEFNTLAFKSNFLYTPISKSGFMEKYAGIKKVINPEFVLIAEDTAKNVIGYIFCIDNFFNPNAKSLIIKTLARHPDRQWKGLGHVLADIIYQKAIAQNYTSIIHAFIFEDGTSTALAKKLSGIIYKNYNLYGKEIA